MTAQAPLGGLSRRDRSPMLLAVAAMALIVVASNILVQYPVRAWGLEDWFTYGAFTYPFAFLVTDLANRRFGPAGARRVVLVGFAAAVALSVYFASPRIAIASGSAFLVSHLVDIGIFNRLRGRAWWLPPFASSIVASAIDTALFFFLAFHCSPVLGEATISQILAGIGIADECLALPWQTLALADYGVKVLLAVLAILPYGAALRLMRSPDLRRGAA